MSGVGTFVLTAIMFAILVQGDSQGADQMNWTEWWPLYVVATTIVLSAGLHLTAAVISRPSRAEPPIKATDTENPASAERIFVVVSATTLTQPFRDHPTIKANRIVQDYLGKWVRWDVAVRNIHSPLSNGSLNVSAEESPMDEHLGRESHVWLEFTAVEATKVMHLERRSRITIEGQLNKIESHSIDLVDCRLVTTPATRH